MTTVSGGRTEGPEQAPGGDQGWQALAARVHRGIVVVTDRSGRPLWVSPSSEQVLGRPASELVGDCGSTLTHPDDVVTLAETFRQAAEAPGFAVPCATRVRHADGTWRWFEGSTINLLDDPDVGAFVFTANEVTRRRAAEERLRALLTTTTMCTLVLGPDATLTYASEAAEPIFGYPPEQLIGTNPMGFMHPDDLGEAGEHLRQTVESPGEPITFTVRIIRPDDTVRWTEATVVNLMHDPDVGGVLGHFRDVTERVEAERALREREERFEALVHNSADLVIVLDAEGTITYTSSNATNVAGVDPADLVGARIFDIAVDPDEGRREVWDDVLASTGEVIRVRSSFDDADGRHWCLDISLQNRLDDPVVRGVVANLHDATEREAAEQAMRRSEERYRALVQQSSDTAVILGADYVIKWVSPAIERMLGRSADAVTGRHAVDLLHPDDVALASRHVQSLVVADPDVAGPAVVRLRHADGTWRWIEALGTNQLDNPAIAGFVLNLRDATERIRFAERLEYQATHDSLTGLPNRWLLLDRLGTALTDRSGDRQTAAIFVDLDRLKIVNDTLGHAAGDRVLAEVANRLRSAVRPEDTIARFAGDEFVVVCDAVSQLAVLRMAESVREECTGHYRAEGATFYVTVSVGVAFAGPQHVDPADLIRDADSAMYRAKENGGNRVEVFDALTRSRALHRLQTEIALRRAIESGRLRLHYQPIRSIATGAVVGVEALVRWDDEDRGLVAPDDFLPLAAERGLLAEIDRWVLDTACRQVKAWQDILGPDRPLALSVNMAGEQLGDPALAGRLRALIDEAGLAEGQLVIELTEHVLLDAADASLADVRAAGARIAIDDFGTGYSSLAYLKRLPVDILKIDQAFVAGLAEDEADGAIVAAVIDLAHTLGLETVAEGVETPAQLSELASLGCDLAQGYQTARPMPPDELETFLLA